MITNFLNKVQVNEYIKNKKRLYDIIKTFIDNEDKTNIDFNDIEKCIKNQEELKDLLYLLSILTSYHHRNSNFIEKIESIIIHFQQSINQSLTSQDLYDIYQYSFPILLFLIENNIINLDSEISQMISSDRFQKYFFYEKIKDFINKDDSEKIKNELLFKNPEIFTNFDKKCRIGENDHQICELIRNDSIDDFIIYVNKTDYPLSSQITSSIFETHPFLIDNKPSLIQYAAFFGSIQIFNYLRLNKVGVDSEIWKYAIHSNNTELISILEDEKIEIDIEKVLEEAVLCHHNEIADHFLMEFNSTEFDIHSTAMECYNYYYFPDDLNTLCDPKYFCLACINDYYTIVKCLLKLNKANYKTETVFFY